MGTFRFEPSARLQRFLGRELISDPNVAVAEFVKNAYDAGASEVRLDFSITAAARRDHVLAIADDGTGMDRESFERNWMRPGYSEKAGVRVPGAPRSPQGAAARRAARRVPIGEKGVGRLAAGRLGERVDVYTRMSRRDRWLHVVFKWSDFDDMQLAMNQVAIPYDEGTNQAELMPFSTGTLIVISDLSLDWRNKVPGRKVNSRSDQRLGRLREDLSMLVQPLESDIDFRICLNIDAPDLDHLGGVLEAGEPETFAYRYEFEVWQSPTGEIHVTRALRRSGDVAAMIDDTRPDPSSEVIGPNSLPGFEDEERPQTLLVGPFSGFFVFSAIPWKRTTRQSVPPGIRIYRDGIRVPPYGDIDDDWLGTRARKASRQGYALQPDSLWGHVRISKRHNPGLTDMSNRDGMVMNDEFEEFLQHVRAEYRIFAEHVEEEWLPTQWVDKLDRVAAAAERATEYEQSFAELYAHRLRGLVGVVQIDMESAAEVVAQLEDRERAERLDRYLTRARDNLRTLDEHVADLIEVAGEKPPEPEEFDIREAIDEALDAARPAFATRGVTVTKSLGTKRMLVLPRKVVVEAVLTMLTNAAEVSRPPARAPGAVDVSVSHDGDITRIAVSDDGIGMSRVTRERLFVVATLTKGRRGLGLIRARRWLRLYGADMACGKSSKSGTIFHVDLPTVGRFRKLEVK